MESDKILDEGKKFKIKVFGLKIPLRIRQLPLNAILRVEKEARNVKYDEKVDGTISALGLSALNIKPKSRIVSYGILRSTFKTRLLSWILSGIIREFVTAKDLDVLMMLVLQHCEINSLFHATILAKSIIPAAGVVTLPEEQQHGDKSQD